MKHAYFIKVSRTDFDTKPNQERKDSREIIFDAKDKLSALIDGLTWALDMKKKTPYENFSCVEIGDYHIDSINPITNNFGTYSLNFYKWEKEESKRTLGQELEFLKNSR